jgi:group II intron reverse transcriptase/maturase
MRPGRARDDTRGRRSSGAKERRSLSPQTIRVQARLAQGTNEGRKHWDLYRWLLDPFVLYDATRLVIANAGAPGLDGETCERIRGREWEYAVGLAEDLRRRRYRPAAVRRSYIPKRDGRKRPLGIPNVRDRVVQRALVLLLEPIYERVFLPCSYGFRPGRSPIECVAQTARLAYRHRHVLEADIERFFDTVSHRKLLGMLRNQVVDPRILDLIRRILRAGFVEVGKPWQPTVEGTPQGGPLSPLLANVYLHYALDVRFRKTTESTGRSVLLRFADDFVILSRRKSEIAALRRAVYVWMREAHLKLKEEKTRLVDLRNKARGYESKFNFLGFKIHLRAYRDRPHRFWIARQPSEESRKTLRRNLKERLSPTLSLPAARAIIRAVWTGWANYFRYGNSNRVFYREIHSVRWIVKGYLGRKYRRQRRPVPWRRLRPRALAILAGIRPLRVISDSWRQRQGALALV